MEMRPLGRTGFSIAPLVLGGNVFGWTADETTSLRAARRFRRRRAQRRSTPPTSIRAGCPATRAASRETIIGNWLKADRGNRDKVVIITKVGSEMGPGQKGLSATYIEQAVEASLRRLQDRRHRPLPVALAGSGRRPTRRRSAPTTS